MDYSKMSKQQLIVELEAKVFENQLLQERWDTLLMAAVAHPNDSLIRFITLNLPEEIWDLRMAVDESE